MAHPIALFLTSVVRRTLPLGWVAVATILVQVEHSVHAASIDLPPTPDLQDPSQFRDIAEAVAPVVLQGLGSNPDLDIFTRFDFDGDLNAYNNWKNASAFTKLPAVYYDVTESRDRYFVTFGLFYPRDYETICVWMICHENDFEGMRVTIDKNTAGPHAKSGRIILLETLAHDRLYRDERPDLIDLDGRGSRVVIVSEASGHGLWPHRNRRPDKKIKVYGPRDYELLPLSDLWKHYEQVGTGKMWQKSFTYDNGRFRIKNIPSAFGGTKWGSGRAHPPWAWSVLRSGLKRGDWFLDPIASQAKYFSLASKTDEYVFSRYFQINRVSALETPGRSAKRAMERLLPLR